MSNVKLKASVKLKLIVLLTILITILAVVSVNVKAQTVKNSINSKIGKIEDGVVTNAAGTKIGFIDTDGRVYDSDKEIIGSIEEDGTIRNPEGVKLGRVFPNGILKDAKEEKMIGRIDVRGYVWTHYGKKLGKVENIEQDIALASFFFFFFRQV